MWWPSRHLEVSTKAGYRANLHKHFLPHFGAMPMAEILPSTVQGWVTKAVADGLSAGSVVKYHVMLHGVFKRAVRDRVIGYNPQRRGVADVRKFHAVRLPAPTCMYWLCSSRQTLTSSEPR